MRLSPRRLSPAVLLGACAGLLAGLAGAAAAQPMEVRISEPIRPERVERTVSGFCGPDRFRVALRPGGDVRAARLVEIEVNGAAISAGERNRLVSRLPDGAFVMDASVAECSGHGPTVRARMRLLIQQPARDGSSRFLECWVSRSGTVTDVRFN